MGKRLNFVPILNNLLSSATHCILLLVNSVCCWCCSLVWLSCSSLTLASDDLRAQGTLPQHLCVERSDRLPGKPEIKCSLESDTELRYSLTQCLESDTELSPPANPSNTYTDLRDQGAGPRRKIPITVTN